MHWELSKYLYSTICIRITKVYGSRDVDTIFIENKFREWRLIHKIREIHGLRNISALRYIMQLAHLSSTNKSVLLLKYFHGSGKLVNSIAIVSTVLALKIRLL